MMSGLSNQRIALVGLIGYAARNGGLARLPDHMVNFSPGLGRSQKDYGLIAIEDVIDIPTVLSGPASAYITTDAATDILGLDTFFAEGVKALAETKDAAALAAQTLLSLEPSRPIREHAARIVDWLGDDVFAVQLRIERDWAEYLHRKFNASEVDTDTDYATCSAATIAKRIVAANIGPRLLWGCCDEADLTVSLDDIRRDFADAGLRMAFKTELPDHLAYPRERLRRAFLEFTVCRSLGGYVGLGRSTFSQTLWLDNLWRGRQIPHYIYDRPRTTAAQRR